MALPSSGTISASMINTESATVSTDNAPLSGTSGTPQAGSLVLRYDDATPTPVNQVAPHAYSEFYGKSFTPPDIACGGVLNAGSGAGYFEATITSGNPTGAIVVYFWPQGVPDGVAYEFNGTTYNNLTSNTYGLAIGTGTKLTIVGDDDFSSCNYATLSAASPMTLDTSVWNGTSFGVNGGTISVDTTVLHLNGSSGSVTYTLVVPKPSSTPTTGTLKIVGPCSGTAWNVKVLCPAALPSFTTNSVQSTFPLACCAAQNQTYYFARNATGNQLFTVDTNTLPQAGNFVFSNNTGANVLANGYYKITSNTAIFVGNGVVDSIYTGCSGCLTSFFVTSASSKFSTSVCGTQVNTEMWHDGSGTLPSLGSNVYTNSGGTTAASWTGYKGFNTTYGSNAVTAGRITSGAISQAVLC